MRHYNIFPFCRTASSSLAPSGFGFELTMRLKREAGETGPPTWPAELLQALARYVFQSGNLYFTSRETQRLASKLLKYVGSITAVLRHARALSQR